MWMIKEISWPHGNIYQLRECSYKHTGVTVASFSQFVHLYGLTVDKGFLEAEISCLLCTTHF